MKGETIEVFKVRTRELFECRIAHAMELSTVTAAATDPERERLIAGVVNHHYEARAVVSRARALAIYEAKRRKADEVEK